MNWLRTLLTQLLARRQQQPQYHTLPKTRYHEQNNPFGVIKQDPKDIDWQSVNDARINAVDRLYPCLPIAKVSIVGHSVTCNIQSNDFMGSWAQVRDSGIKVPFDRIPVNMTAMEWDAWARTLNTYLKLSNEVIN